MFNRRYLAWLIIFSALPASVSFADTEWRTFTSASGGFSVLLPGIPAFSTSTDHTVVGAVVENLYSLKVSGTTFSAEYSDLPGAALFFKSDKSLYNDAREGLLKETGAVEAAYSDIELEGVRGKELTYDISSAGKLPALQGRARFFLRGKRLYVLAVTISAAGGEETAALRFLDSFRILEEAAQAR